MTLFIDIIVGVRVIFLGYLYFYVVYREIFFVYWIVKWINFFMVLFDIIFLVGVVDGILLFGSWYFIVLEWNSW